MRRSNRSIDWRRAVDEFRKLKIFPVISQRVFVDNKRTRGGQISLVVMVKISFPLVDISVDAGGFRT